LILVSFSTKIVAQNQLLDSLTLDTLTAYTNLEQALKSPEKVVKLVLRRNKLKTFPIEIFQFTNLQYLDLSKNNIKEIPSQIGTLKDLQYFSISKNGLEKFPSQIGDLTNLYYLNGNQNELTDLPPEIGQLKNLRNLDLWDNNIDMLPDEIKNCKKLKTLDLRAIMISDAKQDQIHSLLRHTKIYFSPSCKCQQ
jgi:Leucine-rich repeat (LRR) protein